MFKTASRLFITLGLALLVSAQTPALAEDAAPAQTPIPAAALPAPHNDEEMPITMGPGMEDFEKLKAPEREKRFEEMRDKLRRMSPEERQEWKQKRKEWFDSLPADQKDSVKAKMKKNRLVRLNYVLRDMPEQCQAIVKKCMADNGEPLDQKPSAARKK